MNNVETEGADATLGEDVTTSLRKVLNSHGHGFHYSVLRYADELSRNQRSWWALEACEFPVRTGGFDARIDFVLKRKHEEIYLVAECKRANPATSNWCFVRAPYVNRRSSQRRVITECMFREGASDLVSSSGEELMWSDDLYHLGFELRAAQKGDPGGTSRTQIEDAATQVAKGINGLVTFLQRRPNLLQVNGKTRVLGAIFTTANVWASDADLSAATLESGNLSPEAVGAVRKPWLWLQYHVSPGLRHDAPLGTEVSSMSQALELEYARGIAVVGPDGIADFLCRDWS